MVATAVAQRTVGHMTLNTRDDIRGFFRAMFVEQPPYPVSPLGTLSYLLATIGASSALAIHCGYLYLGLIPVCWLSALVWVYFWRYRPRFQSGHMPGARPHGESSDASHGREGHSASNHSC